MTTMCHSSTTILTASFLGAHHRCAPLTTVVSPLTTSSDPLGVVLLLRSYRPQKSQIYSLAMQPHLLLFLREAVGFATQIELGAIEQRTPPRQTFAESLTESWHHRPRRPASVRGLLLLRLH
jgi:hypothetical protein